MQESRRPAVTETPGTDHDRDQPVVSVIVPTYNRAWSVRKTVESVFAQTYRPIECLIVDDGSTDDTPSVADQLTKECPRDVALRYFRKPNGSANTARNRGLAESTGEYVCYLDSDDLLLPDAIELRARVLSANQDVDLCYGLVSLRDEEGKEIQVIGEPWPSPGEARVSVYLFHTMAPLMRRSLCVKAGPWREDDLHGQEYEYFARLKYFARRVVFVDRVLAIYLRHGNESIFQRSHEFMLALFRMLFAIEALVVYGEHDSPQERRCLAMEFRKVAKQLCRLKDYHNGRAALSAALALHWQPKVLGQWLAVAALSILGGLKSQYPIDHPPNSLGLVRGPAGNTRGDP